MSQPTSNPQRRLTASAGAIQVSSRYLVSASASSASSRKRPAPDTKPHSTSLLSSSDHAPSKRAKKSIPSTAPTKTPRKKSLAPTSSSAASSSTARTAVTPRRRTTVGATGSSSAVDRELLQLAASIRTRTAAPLPSVADVSVARREPAISVAPPRTTTHKSLASDAPLPAPASRKSTKPGSAPGATAPPSLAPIPLDPTWTDVHTHVLHRLVQWTYLVTSTAATHATDHDGLQSCLTRAANLVDMRTRLVDALRERVTWECVHGTHLSNVRKETQRVQTLVDRLMDQVGGVSENAAARSRDGFCGAHARVVRALQAGMDLVALRGGGPGGAHVSDVDEFVDQVRAAGLALDQVVGALDAEALQEASKQVDALLAHTARLVEFEERERHLQAQVQGIQLRASSMAVNVSPATPARASVVGQSVMASLGL